MIGSFFIIAMLFYIIYKTKNFNVKTTSNKKFKLLVISTLILTLIQVILGTQVRQYVDEQTMQFGFQNETRAV